MGRQTVPISCDDIATYGYCSACKISFKTDNISRSKMIQIYEAHCNTKHHLNVIQNVKTEETSEDYAVQIAALVEKDIKKQEQIDILIKAVKQLSQENMEMTERFMRAEHRYKQLTTDLFGAANKYGRENDSLVAYKSFNERISALEKSIVATPIQTPKKEPIEEPEAKPETIFVEEDDMEQYNPYKIKEKTEFSDMFEMPDEVIDKINIFPELLDTKDEDGPETLEEIQYEIENMEYWLDFIRKNSKQVLNGGKISQITDDLKNITKVLEKIIDNFENPKYNMENKCIVNIFCLMKKYASKVWTRQDFI
jgi:hypothetical protein